MYCQTLHARNRTGFFPFATTAWYFIRVICVFWQEFSLFLIRCALYLHACLLWLWFLEMRLNIACRFCMWTISCLTFALTSAAFSCETGLMLQWNQVCKHFRKLLVQFHPLWFLTEDRCAKTFASIHYFDTGKKKSHTQSRCFVLSVFLSPCISKATLFAFTGSAPCHESTLSAVVNIQVTFTFPQINWIFVLGDCVVPACRLSWERDWTGAFYFW